MRSIQNIRGRGASARKKQDGFSLIELLIAMLILIIGFLAMANMHVMAMFTNASAQHITEGTALAQSKMEELLGLSYTDLLDTDGDYIEETPDASYYDGSYFSVFRRVTNDPEGVSNLKKIEVKVEWREIRLKRIVLTSVKARVM